MELSKSDWETIKKSPPWAIDSWGLGRGILNHYEPLNLLVKVFYITMLWEFLNSVSLCSHFFSIDIFFTIFLIHLLCIFTLYMIKISYGLVLRSAWYFVICFNESLKIIFCFMITFIFLLPGCLVYELFSSARLAKTEELRGTASIPKVWHLVLLGLFMVMSSLFSILIYF